VDGHRRKIAEMPRVTFDRSCPGMVEISVLAGPRESFAEQAPADVHEDRRACLPAPSRYLCTVPLQQSDPVGGYGQADLFPVPRCSYVGPEVQHGIW
jgi:hypothetical protein